MAKIVISPAGAKSALALEDSLKKTLGSCAGEVESVRNGLRMKIAGQEHIASRLIEATQQLERESASTESMRDGLAEIVAAYERTEKANSGALQPNGTGLDGKGSDDGGGDEGMSPWRTFLDEFLKNFGVSELLAGSGYIGRIYDLVSDIKDADSWLETFESWKDVGDFISEASKTYSNYKKIGNAVGAGQAHAWWLRKVTGFKPLGRASTAKNPFLRFKNNLTNKTSPFNAEIKESIGNFTGKNGAGKALASWASVAVSGVVNWFGNKEEQAESGGKMSDERVVAETVVETAVDTAAAIGAKALVGAAVTTVLGTTAAPAIVVVALTGAVLAGINAGAKALTGESATELLSDFILDTGEKIGKAVGDAAKSVKKAVGGWIKKLKFA